MADECTFAYRSDDRQFLYYSPYVGLKIQMHVDENKKLTRKEIFSFRNSNQIQKALI